MKGIICPSGHETNINPSINLLDYTGRLPRGLRYFLPDTKMQRPKEEGKAEKSCLIVIHAAGHSHYIGRSTK